MPLLPVLWTLVLFPMEVSQLIESLDNLWFFTDVFSSTPKPVGHCCPGNMTIEEETPKPSSPIVQSQYNEPQEDEILTPQSLKCGEFPAQVEKKNAEAITVEEEVELTTPPAKKEERKKRRRKSKRKTLGELDSGFDGRYNYRDYGFSVFFPNKETCRYGIWGGQPCGVKMPPLNDGMAMKQHLKSWAYAVACSVR